MLCIGAIPTYRESMQRSFVHLLQQLPSQISNITFPSLTLTIMTITTEVLDECGYLMQTLTILLVNMFHSSQWQCLCSSSSLFFGQWLAGQITPETLFMGQQYQVKSIFRFKFMLPTKQNIATGLDCCFCFALFFFQCLLRILSKTPILTCYQFYYRSWGSSTVGLGQWWSQQKLVSRCPGRLLCSQLDHASWWFLASFPGSPRA